MLVALPPNFHVRAISKCPCVPVLGSAMHVLNGDRTHAFLLHVSRSMTFSSPA